MQRRISDVIVRERRTFNNHREGNNRTYYCIILIQIMRVSKYWHQGTGLRDLALDVSVRSFILNERNTSRFPCSFVNFTCQRPVVLEGKITLRPVSKRQGE